MAKKQKSQGEIIEALIVEQWVAKYPKAIRPATQQEQKYFNLDLIIDSKNTIKKRATDFCDIIDHDPRNFKAAHNVFSDLLFIDVKAQVKAIYNINVELYNYDQYGTRINKWWYTSFANQYWWVLKHNDINKLNNKIYQINVFDKCDVEYNINSFADQYYKRPITEQQLEHLQSLPPKTLDIKPNGIDAQQNSVEWNQSYKRNYYETLLYNIKSLPVHNQFDIDLSSIIKDQP